ncbi:hypothetical protein [Methylorubrum suomiense]|uniref:Uncharacterized protein n=1 Tax=Methylorubrum suomiense TaxID=144191 RepID=A0ABQ4USI9_9HYPH|nr:hypothetical protein [Methylorubrum suomiense]GJE74334.1 hypothetical protein BGCPKDLD_0903 [Methylorubrum suomiense]
MRAALALVAGGPGRVSISAAAIVAIAFVLAGHGWDLARAAWHASLFVSGFVGVWAVLALIAQAAGVADDTTPSSTAAKEASHD